MTNAFKSIGEDILAIIKEAEWRKIMIRIIIVLAICSAVMGGCSYFNRQFGLDDDNPLEQAVEDVIEHQTGIEIDLTPEQ